jgi:hypothetical protein
MPCYSVLCHMPISLLVACLELSFKCRHPSHLHKHTHTHIHTHAHAYTRAQTQALLALHPCPSTPPGLPFLPLPHGCMFFTLSPLLPIFASACLPNSQQPYASQPSLLELCSLTPALPSTTHQANAHACFSCAEIGEGLAYGGGRGVGVRQVEAHPKWHRCL